MSDEAKEDDSVMEINTTLEDDTKEDNSVMEIDSTIEGDVTKEVENNIEENVTRTVDESPAKDNDAVAEMANGHDAEESPEKNKENRENNDNKEKPAPIRAIRLVAIEKLMEPSLVDTKPERMSKRNTKAHQSIVELSDSSESSEPPKKKKKSQTNGIDYNLSSSDSEKYSKKSKKSSKNSTSVKTRESTRTLRGGSSRSSRRVTFRIENDDESEESVQSSVTSKRSTRNANRSKNLKEGHNLKDLTIKVVKLPTDLTIIMKRHNLEEILDGKNKPITKLKFDEKRDRSANKKSENSSRDKENSKSNKTEASRAKKRSKLFDSDESDSIFGEIASNMPGKAKNKNKTKVDDDNIPAKNGTKVESDSSGDEEKPLVKLSGQSTSKPSTSSRSKKLISDSEEEEQDEKDKKKSRREEKGSKKKAKSDDETGDNSDESDSIGNWKKMDKRSKRTDSKKKKKQAVVDSSDEEKYNVEENGSDDEYDPSNGKRSRSSDDDSDYGAKKTEDSKVQPKKKRSRIRKPKDSSSSDDSDDEGGSDSDIDAEKPSTKRKRKNKKKKGSDDSENSDDDDDNDSPTKGRKNIRKLIGKGRLEEATKQAEREERERKERLAERQKLYNQVYDEKPEEVKELTSLVLDFNDETKEPIIEVDKKLVKKLKPHQANGIKFMWDACFESVRRMKKSPGAGCILAHCMGLGKTLQVVTLCHTLLSYPKTKVERILIVCPLSTVLNWVNEFKIWMKHCAKNKDIEIYEISKLKNNIFRANKLMEWHNEGGIMILGYDMFRNLSNDQGTKIKKKVRESLQTTLVNPGPDMIVCDEGHLLKNEKTALAKCINRVKTLRRIILTGTPIQNNMKEYYCMVQFVKPNLLGTYQEYMNRFVNPITNGQYTDSTQYDIQLMRKRAHILHRMLDGCVQRRDYGVLAPFLPPKHEYVLSIKLTELQCNLYRFYMENIARGRSNDGIQRRASVLFNDFQNLQRIWTHPRVLRYNSDKYEEVQQKKRDLMSDDDEEGSLKDFLDDESDTSTSASGSEESVSLESNASSKNKKKVPIPRRTRNNADLIEETFHEPIPESKAENPTEWWMTMCPEENLDDMTLSGKLLLLFKILKECENIGDKLLVFSQSLYSLDVIEHFLDLIDRNNQMDYDDQDPKLREFNGSWSAGLDYFRLDGSTSIENRNLNCRTFNDNDNHRARLYLISTRAGGLGINLFAANRVVIFDVSWNPSNDIQSIFRVYRFGQNKPCYIYRFVAMGTMEEKIYERQVTKQAISKRVIDEQQIDRHYNQNDLQELYRYDGIDPEEPRLMPVLPKDRLFAEMLKICEDIIYKYHEHDSLLENKEEETLNEEERKAAWEEFEAEKNRPPPSLNNYVSTGGLGPYGSGVPIKQNGPVTSNSVFGIRNDVLLRLLNLKARQDNPGLTDTQIAYRVPLLMQELIRQMKANDNTLYNNLLQIFNQLQNPTFSSTGLMMGPFGMYPSNYGVAAAMSNLQQNVQNIQEKTNLQQATTEQQQQMNMLRYHQELTQRRYAEMAKNTQTARPKIDPNAPIETIDLDD